MENSCSKPSDAIYGEIQNSEIQSRRMAEFGGGERIRTAASRQKNEKHQVIPSGRIQLNQGTFGTALLPGDMACHLKLERFWNIFLGMVGAQPNGHSVQNTPGGFVHTRGELESVPPTSGARPVTGPSAG
jgi:hypothetical protein